MLHVHAGTRIFAISFMTDAAVVLWISYRVMQGFCVFCLIHMQYTYSASSHYHFCSFRYFALRDLAASLRRQNRDNPRQTR
jgi:hypothetical protein